MKLLVIELNNSVSQTIVPSKNTNVEAIRPHIYKHNFPLGTVAVEIHDTYGELIAQSESLNISEISEQAFYHGYIRFYIKAYLRAGVSYKIVIKTSDYVFSESAYLGVCNSFDLSSYPATYSPNLGVNSPIGLEIWEKTSQR